MVAGGPQAPVFQAGQAFFLSSRCGDERPIHAEESAPIEVRSSVHNRSH